MTIGEMAALTKRFHQIKGASQPSKNKRLTAMLVDIEQAFAERGLFNDTAAYWMHKAVLEEIEGETNETALPLL